MRGRVSRSRNIGSSIRSSNPMPAFQPNDLSEVVMAVAFAIEDPCGLETIELARALIDMGRSVPERQRAGLTQLIRRTTQSFNPKSGG